MLHGRVNAVGTHVQTLPIVSHTYTHKEPCLLSSASIKWFKLCTLVTQSISNEFSV